MAVSRIQTLGSAQSKTSGTSISWNPAATVTAGDDIFVSFAADDTITAGPTCSDNLTNSYSLIGSVTNAGNVRTYLFRAHNISGGSLTNIQISWTGATVAKAAAAAQYRGVGTQRGSTQTSTGTGSPTYISSPSGDGIGTVWQTGDLVIGAGGWEGPGSDFLSVFPNQQSPPDASLTVSSDGSNGTSGGGATSNIGTNLCDGIATQADQNSADSIFASMANSRDWASVGAVFQAAATGSPQTVNPTGLGSAGSFGTPTARNIIAVSGLASAASFGSVTAVPGGVTKSVTGLASAASFGSITIVPGPVTKAVSGLASAANFGSPTPRNVVIIGVSGLGSAQAFGTVTPVPGNLTRAVNGLASAQAFGTVTPVPGAVTRAVSGLSSAQSFGTIKGNLAFAVVGLGSAQAFGTPTVTLGGTGQTVSASGLASAASFGSVTPRPGPVIAVVAGLGSAQSFGAPTGNQTKAVGGVSTAQAFGSITPVVGPVVVLITGVGSAQTFSNVATSGGSAPTFNPATMGRHIHR